MLSTEDYLFSLISVINELSRLAVTSVTLGDFNTPITLSAFVKDLHAGFQLLNLKNNDLRKRFDSIKVRIERKCRWKHLLTPCYLHSTTSRRSKRWCTISLCEDY
jgi:predicted translin family RNA/ssDNA-binding protein